MKSLLIITAYLAPFFFIPATFRFAGGIFGRVSGMFSDRSRGFFDRQRKYREGKRSSTIDRAKSGGRFRGQWLGGKFNRGVQGLYTTPAAAGQNWRHPTLIRSSVASRMNTSQNFDTAQKFLQENTAARAIKDNDMMVGAIFDSGASQDPQVIRQALLRRGQITEDIKEDIMEDEHDEAGNVIGQKKVGERKVGERVIGNAYSNPDQLDQATNEILRFNKEAANADVARLAAGLALAPTGTGFNGNNPKMAEVIATLAGDNGNLQGRLTAAMRSGAMQAGRVDQGGGGFGDTMAAVTKLRSSMKNGGFILDANGNRIRYTAQDATNDIADSASKSNSAAYLLSGKAASTEAIAEAFARRLSKAIASVGYANNDFDRRKALNEVSSTMAAIAGLNDAQGGSAAQNSSKMAELMGTRLDLTTFHPEVRNLLTTYHRPDGAVQDTKPSISIREGITYLASGDRVFNESRKEWQNAIAAQSAGAAGQATAQAGGMDPPPGQPKN